MIKLDKDRIRYHALNSFHNKYHASVYDCWTDALHVWLSETGNTIVSLEDAARISAKEHQEMSKLFKVKNDADREAKVDATDSEESKN